MSTFLILGGTGKVGSRTVRQLRAGGHTARVASRTAGDVVFDWRDESTYEPAVRGIDGIFIVGPGSAKDWSASLTLLLQIASAAGVSKVVFLSARGVEFLPDGAVARAERALTAGAVPWVILRPTHFAQNFTEAMFVPVGGVIAAPVADGAEPFIDVEDIAQVAARLLTVDEWMNRTVEISGPAAITFAEAARVLSARSGANVSFVDEEPERHADRLRAAGTPEGYVEWRMAMLRGIRSGNDSYLSDGVQDVLGRPAGSFDEWAVREASALSDGSLG
ncbi:NAD(P)H-binding protein [Glaciihabitans sp. dw_435]|uniref:NAD(P)H-binding protein n=1 Tax=Glaciihabitans sp. dw_435 TaxID=2720081 RepID=UPI001BD5F362|nr:NAD(P)H-binding protein [Glaciihabitans sp. dw_435]